MQFIWWYSLPYNFISNIYNSDFCLEYQLIFWLTFYIKIPKKKSHETQHYSKYYFGKVIHLDKDGDSGCKNVTMTFLHDDRITNSEGFRLYAWPSNPDTSIVDTKCIFTAQWKPFHSPQCWNLARGDLTKRKSFF